LLARFAPSGTNPEELIAAAHAGCFTTALSAFLGNAGFAPEGLSTRATLTLKQVGGNWTITATHLDLSGRVPGIDAANFDEIADRQRLVAGFARAQDRHHPDEKTKDLAGGRMATVRTENTPIGSTTGPFVDSWYLLL
jgi:hypothetical protein